MPCYISDEHAKSSPLNSTHYVVLYPQNGDRIVAIDSVTSLHPVYITQHSFSILTQRFQITLDDRRKYAQRASKFSISGHRIHRVK